MENRQPPPGDTTIPERGDIAPLRQRARRELGRSAMTSAYSADRSAVVGLLNAALATGIVCMLRYRRHYFVAFGLVSEAVRQRFLAHAQQQLVHADCIAARIVQLGGEPDFNPRGLTERSHAEYVVGHTLESMVREHLVAERIAIDSHRQMVAYLGARDPTTRRLMEEILANEEERAAALAALLQGVSCAARTARA